MVAKYRISFQETAVPIDKPVTKFGGQPVWVQEAEWPRSKSSGRLMQFIGQILIPGDLFSISSEIMAYIFISEQEEFVNSRWQRITGRDGWPVDKTWDAEGGENHVVLQSVSAGWHTSSTLGPSLYRLIHSDDGTDCPEECEFNVMLSRDVDDIHGRHSREGSRQKFENKIGGNPEYVQDREPSFLKTGHWHLLLQLWSSNVPFFINFGDAGVGYIFFSDDMRRAKFHWQCF